MTQTIRKRGLGSNTLKLIAALLMFADHAALCFLSDTSAAGVVLHTLGHASMPLFCFFLAEGYYYTKSVPKYALRLLIFGVLSQVPYTIVKTGGIAILPLNVMFTLLLGLLALWGYNELEHDILRLGSILAACALATVLHADWGLWGVLFIVVFGLNPRTPVKQAGYFAAVAGCKVLLDSAYAYQMGDRLWLHYIPALGLFLAIPLFCTYNFTRKQKSVLSWFFYVFYPLHFLILMIIALKLILA